MAGNEAAAMMEKENLPLVGEGSYFHRKAVSGYGLEDLTPLR